MRVTSSMFYQDTIRNNNNLNSELYNVTNRISSGIDIRYAQDDVIKFASTMQLDNEMTTLTQAKNSTQSGYKFSAQTDTALGDISKLLDQFKVKLTAAATDGNSYVSMDAIAKELRGIEETMTNIFNTSIGGEFIFSGTALDKRPISDTKEYMGNDGDLKTFSGSNVQQVYNVSGEKLFFGDENGVQRNISTNIPLINQTLLHPNIMENETIPANMGEEKYINIEDTIRDMMGDSDTTINTTTAQHHFYIQGKRSDGESFKDVISMRDDESVESLLNKIGESYGNTINQDVVNVTMNNWGQIEIQDKLSGSSQIDFNMIANTGTAVTDLNELFATGNNIKEFINSDFTSTPALHKTATVQDYYDQKLYTLPVSFNQVNGVDAKNTDLIQNFLKDANGNAVDRIDMNFIVTESDGTINTLNGINLVVDATTTFKDLEDSIKTQFASATLDTDINIQIQDGVMKISDITSRAADPKTNSSIYLDLTTHNTTLGTNIATMHTPSSASQDNSYFDNSGALVTSNVPQITRDGNSFATEMTKLSEVATGARLPTPNSNLADLTNTNLKLEGK
ncbi:MAG: hypothetical protein U9N42_03325, partial [Campylobacterota bacterium]|nr:hypothetical protein [Campylobacterota bacterium]